MNRNEIIDLFNKDGHAVAQEVEKLLPGSECKYDEGGIWELRGGVAGGLQFLGRDALMRAIEDYMSMPAESRITDVLLEFSRNQDLSALHAATGAIVSILSEVVGKDIASDRVAAVHERLTEALELYDEVDNSDLQSILETSARQLVGNQPAARDDRMWFAIFDTPETDNYAAGNSPAEALAGLLRFWQEHMQFPEYPRENPDCIRIIPIKPGSAVSLGTTDQHWPQDAMNGDHESLKAVWSEFYPEKHKMKN